MPQESESAEAQDAFAPASDWLDDGFVPSPTPIVSFACKLDFDAERRQWRPGWTSLYIQDREISEAPMMVWVYWGLSNRGWQPSAGLALL